MEIKGASIQLKKTLAWLQKNEQITPDPADYAAAARIKAAARRTGVTLELPDCLIAATAVRLNRPVITGNTVDFEAIQKLGLNLLLENWRNP